MSQKKISSGVVHEVPADLKKALTSDALIYYGPRSSLRRVFARLLVTKLGELVRHYDDPARIMNERQGYQAGSSGRTFVGDPKNTVYSTMRCTNAWV